MAKRTAKKLSKKTKTRKKPSGVKRAKTTETRSSRKRSGGDLGIDLLGKTPGKRRSFKIDSKATASDIYRELGAGRKSSAIRSLIQELEDKGKIRPV